MPDVAQRGVVVGRDGRTMSAEFAQDTAEVLAAEGIPAHVFPDAGAHAADRLRRCSHLNAAAAVMVTASHNPPEYNGYKVYWGNGAQIIPPHDSGIAAAIDAVEPADRVKLMPRGRGAQARACGSDARPAEVERAYLDAILALRAAREAARGPAAIVYTAMHGVGGRLALEALRGRRLHRASTRCRSSRSPTADVPHRALPQPRGEGRDGPVAARSPSR